MTNEIKIRLYDMMKNGYDGQCIIIYKKNGINCIKHTHNRKFTSTIIRNIELEDILYICCQKGYSIIKKESNYATDTEIGIIPFSSYDNEEHIKFYDYLEDIYKKFGVENYED